MQSVQTAAQAFRDAGVAIGGVASDIAAAFLQGIDAQLEFVATASHIVKPEGAALQTLLEPISKQIAAIDELASKRGPLDQHCKMVNNAAAAFGWVLEAKPADTIAEALDSTTYIANKLRQAHKGDADHTAFINSLIATMKALESFVKDNYAKGVQWKSGSATAAPPVAASGSRSSTDLQTAAQAFRDAGVAIGGVALDIAAAFLQGIEAQIGFAARAATVKKPEGAALQTLLEPISKQIAAIDELASKRGPLDQHCKMVNNAAAAFGWVLEAKPADTIAEALDSTTYIANKLRQAHKGDADHTAFINSLIAAMKALESFVKDNYAKGVQWGTSGAAPPPPPPPVGKKAPPPPPPPAATSSAAAPAEAGGVMAMFAEIKAKGDNITKGLRHVDDSEKIYKNKEKGTAVPVAVAAASKKDASKPAKGSWRPPTGTAATSLNGDKFWSVQYHAAEDSELEDFVRVTVTPKKHHAINVYRCVNTLIVVEGKCNSIQIVECLNTHVIVNGTLGPVEVSNSQKIEILLSVFTPSVIFSSVKGAVVHLGEPSLLESDFVTSCASNINLVVAWTPERDEIPLHEQFETSIVGNNAVTKPVEHSSSA